MKLLTLMKRPQTGRRRQGMTLLELMVSMSLLTVIILGLYSMFDRTQRALIRGGDEVDVQETGRSAFRVILSHVDRANSPDILGFTNLIIKPNTNWNNMLNLQQTLTQQLVDGSIRIHQLQDFFFLTREGSDWNGRGYFVREAANPHDGPYPIPNRGDSNLWVNGVGSLYRFELTTNHLLTDELFFQTNIANVFQKPSSMSLVNDPTASRSYTNIYRIADGIVHLRVVGYTNGSLVSFGPLADNIPATSVALTNGQRPSHLEIELGVLEPKVLEEMRAMPNATIVRDKLFEKAANVLMFRARIPLRAGNDTEYP